MTIDKPRRMPQKLLDHIAIDPRKRQGYEFHAKRLPGTYPQLRSGISALDQVCELLESE
jgi:hypothetical protein